MNKFELKYLLLEIMSRISLINKKSDVGINDLQFWDIEGCTAKLIISSSNNIFEIIKNNEIYYFRECRKNTATDEFISSLLNDFEYYTGISITKIVRILSANSFLKMGALGNPQSGIDKYFKNHDLGEIGLELLTDDLSYRKNIDLFVHYAWGEILTYNLNQCKGSYNLFNYNRGKSQELIYKLFGQSNLVCGLNLVKIKRRDGKIIVGSIMKQAKGVNPSALSKEELTKNLSPLILKDLTTMNILDALCLEKDHRCDNYNLLKNQDGSFYSLIAFDNDSITSFFPSIRITKSLAKASPIVKNGSFARAYISKSFAEKISCVTFKELIKQVYPYLSFAQIACLSIRYIRLKYHIRKVVLYSKEKLIDGSLGWTASVLDEDKYYAPTYYTNLFTWAEGKFNTQDIFIDQHSLPKLDVKF